jgi:hypothetical protein
MMRAGLQFANENRESGINLGNALSAIAQSVAGTLAEEQKSKAEQDAIAARNKSFFEKGGVANDGRKIGNLVKQENYDATKGEYKINFRSMTPREEESAFDLQRKRDADNVLNSYVNGGINDVDFAKQAVTLYMTDDQIERAVQARRKSSADLIGQQVSNSVAQQNEAAQIQKQKEGVPEGYRAVYEKNAFGDAFVKGFEKIPATEIKAEVDMRDAEKLRELQNKVVVDAAIDTSKTIAEIKKFKGMTGFGPLGSLPTLVPGSERSVWEANINKLLAQRIVDLMTQMKQASKTGATGFGQLNEKELKVLQDASTALKRNLPLDKAMEYLDEMDSVAQKIINGSAKTQRFTIGNKVYNVPRELVEQFKQEKGL